MQYQAILPENKYYSEIKELVLQGMASRCEGGDYGNQQGLEVSLD